MENNKTITKKEKQIQILKNYAYVILAFILLIGSIFAINPYYKVWKAGIEGKAMVIEAQYEAQAAQIRGNCVIK